MDKKMKKITLTAMFSAVIFIFTFLFKVPVSSGYIHLGDVFIYLSVSILGAPWAVISAVIGQSLADLAGGFSIYIPATILVKGAVAFVFSLLVRRKTKLLNGGAVIAVIISVFIIVGGYFCADLIIDKAYAVIDISGNILQTVSSAVVFIVLAALLDRTDFMKHLK